MARSVIIKIHESRDDDGYGAYRYNPPASPTKSPASALLEIVGAAFNDVAQEYNLARHQNLGEAFVPAKADLENRRMYNKVAPDLGIDTKKKDHRSEPIPRYQVRPRRAGDWLSGTAHKDRFHFLPAVLPLDEGRLISEKKAKRDYQEKPRNYNFVRLGTMHGVQRAPPMLIQPDFGSCETRRAQRQHWAPGFERDFRARTGARSIVYSYCTPL